MVSDFLANFPEVLNSDAFVCVLSVFLCAMFWHTFCCAIDTALYCIRMHFYERAILAAKDCEKLCVRPPRRLWDKFVLSKGDNHHAENSPRE